MTNKPSENPSSAEAENKTSGTHSSKSEHSSHGSSHHHSSGHSSHHHSSGHGSHHSSSHSSSHSSTHSSSHSSSHSSHSSSASDDTKGQSTESSSSSGHHHHHHSHTRVDTQRINALVSKYQVVADEDILAERPPKHHHHHHRRKSPLKKALTAALCVLLVLIIGGGTAFAVITLLGKQQVQSDGTGVKENAYSVSYDEGKTLEFEGKKYVLNENIVPVVLIGLDRDEFGLQSDKIGTAGQADMIMLATLNLETGKANGLFIPRDSMVDVDLYSTDGQYVGVDRMQICLSFAYGDGKETSGKNVLNSVQRVLYGIPVQLYGVLDLDGIPFLNDAIGGVTLTSLETFGDTFVEGQAITLYGMQAQQYVRSRNTEILDSDTPRRARQMQYLRAFLQKAVHTAIGDFSIVPRLYNAASDYMFTNVSLSKVTYLATTMLSKGFELENVESLKGELVDAEPYPEFHLDERAVFETVLKTFYTPVEE